MPEPILAIEGLTKSFGALEGEQRHLARPAPRRDPRPDRPEAGKSTLISRSSVIPVDSGTIRSEGAPIDHRGRPRPPRARPHLPDGRAGDVGAPQRDACGRGAIGPGLPLPPPRRPRRRARRGRHGAPPERRARRAPGCAPISATASAGSSSLPLLALRPKVFLLDEPMAGFRPLFVPTAFLDTLRHEAPIPLVEHDMAARAADRISVLVYGRVIATGAVADIRRNSEVRTLPRRGRVTALLKLDGDRLLPRQPSASASTSRSARARSWRRQRTAATTVHHLPLLRPREGLRSASPERRRAASRTGRRGSASGWCPRAGAAFGALDRGGEPHGGGAAGLGHGGVEAPRLERRTQTANTCSRAASSRCSPPAR